MADNGESNRAQMPLQGVVLCCTSVAPERRVELADIASQMGAVHKLDLTSDVTHLIVGDTDTPKYKFVAKERPDVKCLLPTWIDAVRKSWVAGGETDVEVLEAEHALPTFQGLTICVTGFDDLAYRKKLEDLINSNGGDYRGNLTKDVTHLIARVPSGSKYTYAGEWGVKIVSIEWLMQSLERGMVLDEKLYNLLLPESERGQNAWVRKTVSVSSLGKRARDEDSAPKSSRKLRRTASAKLSSQNVGLWTDIVRGGTEVGGNKVDEWDDRQGDQGLNSGTLKAEHSERDSTETPSMNENPNPQLRTQNSLDQNNNFSLARAARTEGIFQGLTFFMHGFNERQSLILQKHLYSHQAEIVQEIHELSIAIQGNKYLLVPHTISNIDIPTGPKGVAVPVVTDMWVERCLHRKALIKPQANVTNTPFPCFPIAGFEKFTISSTAFKDVDLLHLSKAAKLMGATYSEYLNKNTSVLVCNTEIPNVEKLQYALRCKVPVVRADWMWDCIYAGQLKDFEEYLIPSSHELPTETSFELTKLSSNASDSKNIRKPLTRSSKPTKKRSSGQKLETSKDQISAQSLNGSKFDCLRSKDSMVDTAHSDPCAINPGSPRQDDETAEHNPNGKIPNAQDSAHTLLATTPLQEISFNASPKPGLSAEKACSPPLKPIPPTEPEEDSLGPAISSLLAHHQRSSAGTVSRPVSDIPGFGRRRRQLLGRAPSNISTRSNGSIGISRASSIDTMNTDGLGTPLESNCVTKVATTDPFDTLRGYGELEESHETVEEHLQMTQLGYEDPEVQVYRERIIRKMGGMREIETGNRKGVGKRMKSIGIVKDVVGKGTLGVAKRTRQAMGR